MHRGVFEIARVGPAAPGSARRRRRDGPGREQRPRAGARRQLARGGVSTGAAAPQPGNRPAGPGTHRARRSRGGRTATGSSRRDPHLAVEGRHPGHVIGAVHEPGREAAQFDAVDLGDALVQPEDGDRSGVGVHIILRRPPRSSATMFLASRFACRTACCAHGPQMRRDHRGLDRSGTAALSPGAPDVGHAHDLQNGGAHDPALRRPAAARSPPASDWP